MSASIKRKKIKSLKIKKLKAQILVIVVMVLLMLSIIVVGIIAVVTRDVNQSVGSQEFEKSYNKSEEKMLKLLDTYGDVDVSLDGLLTTEGCTLQSTVYECNYNDANLTTQVSVEDTNLVKDFELGKDRTFKIILNNYTGNLEISWTGDTALLMTLEYKTSTGTYKTIQDIYDNANILSQSGSVPADHPFNAAPKSGAKNTITFSVANIAGLVSQDTKIYLKVRVLMNESSHINTLLGIKGDSSLPKQVRKFEGISYFQSDTTAFSSAPTLVTQIPLAGGDPEITNYVLRSNTTVQK